MQAKSFSPLHLRQNACVCRVDRATRSQGRHNSAQRVPDFPVRHDSGALGLSAVSGHNPFCDLELEPLQTDSCLQTDSLVTSSVGSKPVDTASDSRTLLAQALALALVLVLFCTV